MEDSLVISMADDSVALVSASELMEEVISAELGVVDDWLSVVATLNCG